MPIQALGYEAVAHGNGRWNGVAILSRVGLDDVTLDLDAQPPYDGVVETRAVGATCGGVRVWSVYVPNGREPVHDHFAYKLEWFAALRRTVDSRAGGGPPATLRRHRRLQRRPHRRRRLGHRAVRRAPPTSRRPSARPWPTCATPASPTSCRASLKGEPYTFWDYRNGAFHRGWGMRIDLVYANPAFAARVTDTWIDREERKGKGASDHAPVVIDLDDPDPAAT